LFGGDNDSWGAFGDDFGAGSGGDFGGGSDCGGGLFWWW